MFPATGLSPVPPLGVTAAFTNAQIARLTKNFTFGWVRIRANLKVFNVLNNNAVLAVQTRYGATFFDAAKHLAVPIC
jgi:hypothetical protein